LSILLPMLARIGWTFLLSVWLTIARLRAVTRFDLLMFSLELALLKGSKRFGVARKQFIEIASALEGQTSIPTIGAASRVQEIQVPALLYEEPFAAVVPTGPKHPFDEEHVTRRFTRTRAINDSAVA